MALYKTFYCLKHNISHRRHFFTSFRTIFLICVRETNLKCKICSQDSLNILRMLLLSTFRNNHFSYNFPIIKIRPVISTYWFLSDQKKLLKYSLFCLKQVVDLQFDRKNIPMNKLVATTLESKIFCFDVRTQHPKKGFAHLIEKAHDSTVWRVRHLPQNREIFMTTGGSGSLCLWK